MSPAQFIFLPDIVLLEVFSFLCCEDVLYAFGNLNNARLWDLLKEHGAFRQICLSPQLSRLKYHVLSHGIWRYNLVRSLVCKEMFSDFIPQLTPCPIFPSLTELRLLYFRYASTDMEPFIIAHSSTLTHLLLRRSDQCHSVTHIQALLHTVLPHLHRLELLDTDVKDLISIQWSQLAGALQSLQRLTTSLPTLSDVYVLAADGFLPCLQRLRVIVQKAVMKTVSPDFPSTAKIRLAHLKTFDLDLDRRGGASEGETPAHWSDVETLVSPTCMPRLERCSVIYLLSMYDDIHDISRSSLFVDDTRHVRIQFAFYSSGSTAMYFADRTSLRDIRFGHVNDVHVDYNDEDKSKLRYGWFASSWPSWTTCWMGYRGVIPSIPIRQLRISASNVSLDAVSTIASGTNDLELVDPASFCVDSSSMARSTAFINLRRLGLYSVVPGVELLFDSVRLPALHTIYGLIVPLFVALVRRAQPMQALPAIERVVILDHAYEREGCLALKQWWLLLDVFPRLRTLLIQLSNARCPSMGMLDLFLSYIKRKTRAPLTLFSCCIDETNDVANKEHFIKCLEEKLCLECPLVQLSCINSTRLDAWM